MDFIKGDRGVLATSEALSQVWRLWWPILKSGTVHVEQNKVMSAVAEENKFSRFLDHGIVLPLRGWGSRENSAIACGSSILNLRRMQNHRARL